LSYKNCFRSIAGIAGLLLSLTFAQPAESQTRIAGAIKNEERVAVQGTTSPLIAGSLETGRMAGGQNLGRMVLLLSPSPEQEAGAEKLVDAQHDPSSPLFHKWLTPGQFGQRFGVSDADAAQVQQWLQTQGLTVHEVSQSRRFIVFSGTVTQVQAAFSTEMHTYAFKGKSFVSNSSDIQIPAALTPVVKGIVRLHSDPRMSEVVAGGKVHFNKSTGKFESGGGHYLAPADFAKIYNLQPLYDAGIDGTGQTIAIVGRSNINVQDVRDFRTQLGLPANDPVVIVNGDDPNQTSDLAEAVLDVTWSGALAPMATIKFVVSQSNFADGVDVSAAYIVDHNLAPVMSTSYGSCEQTMGAVGTAFYNSLWKQAAAQGITSFVSSGDSGGAGCDPSGGSYATGVAVNGLASTAYNVAVGGTMFDDTANPTAYWNPIADPTTGLSALGYIPEMAWNESSNDPNGVLLLGGGGGVSTIHAKPNWQVAPGVPTDGKRDVPDFSLTAAVHDGYLLCLFGSCGGGQYFYVFGGTSASSPSAAGIMALVNQKMGGLPQGVANYVFYRLAAIPGVYHDVTKGDNKVPDASGQYTVGYSAGTGYDLATGLGSFDGNALVNNWQTAANALGSATTLALGGGQTLPVVHGTPITFTSTVKCSVSGACKSATGLVTLQATDANGNVFDAGTAQLKTGSPSNVTFSTTTVPGGTFNVTARYSGDGTYYSSVSTAVSVTVTREPSQTLVGGIGGGSFTTVPLTVQYGEPFPLAIVVAGKSGSSYPTGQMSLLADGQPASTLGAFGQKPSDLTLNYGEKSFVFASGNTPTSQSSTVAFLPSCVPGPDPSLCLPSKLTVGSHQLQANYPGDNSFASSQGSYNFTVIKADSFFADFFPLGTPVIGVPVQMAGQIGLVNNWCAPYGGTLTVTDITGTSPIVLGSGPVSPTYCDSYFVPVTFRTPGTHSLKLSFSGDSNVNGSSSSIYYVPVASNAPSSTSLLADVPTAMAGGTVTLTATVVTPVAGHQPNGQSVTFLDGSTVIGTAPLGNPTDFGGGSFGLTAQLAVTTLAGGPHNLIASYAGDAVLTPSDSSSSPVLVTIMDYTVQGAPSALTIEDGQTGTATLSVFPLGGFSQTVQFSCGTLPAHVSCSFSQAQITPDGVHPSNVTLTVNTGGKLASNIGESGLWAVTSTFALTGVLLPFRRRRGWKTSLATFCFLAVGLFGFGCGSSSGGGNGSGNGSNSASRGGPNGAPVGSFTLTVSTTSASVPAAKTVTLSVNIVK
jgi:Pro-kumamolisin, activation domain/Bacterial Ig-like domain (group 3)